MNSLNKYYKNLILCGQGDYICLICSEAFISDSDLEKHLLWQQHKTKVKNYSYVPKFRKEFIYKIGEEYYCELCNIVITTLDEIPEHKQDQLHKARKAKPDTPVPKEILVTKHTYGSVVVGDVVMNKEQWHGIIGNRCIICNDEEVTININEHIKSFSHVKNIISKKVKYIDSEKFYRQMDATNGYCFHCKTSVLLETIDEHWLTPAHVEQCKRWREKVLFYNYDVLERDAVCRTCKAIISMEDKIAIIRHRTTHPDDLSDTGSELFVDQTLTEPKHQSSNLPHNHGLTRSILAGAARNLSLRLHPGGRVIFCNFCNVYISPNLKVLKNHVVGARHRGFLEWSKTPSLLRHEICTYSSVSLEEYVKSVSVVVSLNTLWINETTCITPYSFYLLYPQIYDDLRYLRCLACGTSLVRDTQVVRHFENENHTDYLINCKVLKIKNEFVREVNPQVYHCGYCNMIFPYFETLRKHLMKKMHLHNKMIALRSGRHAYNLQKFHWEGKDIDREFFRGVLGWLFVLRIIS